MNSKSGHTAEALTTEAICATTPADSTDGRILGWLSIAAAPGAVLVSPAVFSVGGFFLAMLGLTLAAPSQRVWSILGIIASVAGGAVGYYLKTPIV